MPVIPSLLVLRGVRAPPSPQLRPWSPPTRPPLPRHRAPGRRRGRPMSRGRRLVATWLSVGSVDGAGTPSLSFFPPMTGTGSFPAAAVAPTATAHLVATNQAVTATPPRTWLSTGSTDGQGRHPCRRSALTTGVGSLTAAAVAPTTPTHLVDTNSAPTAAPTSTWLSARATDGSRMPTLLPFAPHYQCGLLSSVWGGADCDGATGRHKLGRHRRAAEHLVVCGVGRRVRDAARSPPGCRRGRPTRRALRTCRRFLPTPGAGSLSAVHVAPTAMVHLVGKSSAPYTARPNTRWSAVSAHGAGKSPL